MPATGCGSGLGAPLEPDMPVILAEAHGQGQDIAPPGLIGQRFGGLRDRLDEYLKVLAPPMAG